MKKTIHFHIGRDKCGSSTIQKFCENHRDALLADGYFYPPTSGLRFHGLVSPVFYRGAGSADESGTHLRALLEAIEAAPSREVILSSESFYLDDPAYFDAFKHHDIRFIYYVRRQDDYLESAFNQRIREGSLDPLYVDSSIADGALPPILDYLSAPRKLADRFGPDSVELRLFDRAAFEGGNLIHDFLSAVRHPEPGKYAQDTASNTSLRGTKLKFAAHLCLVPVTRSERFEMMGRLRKLDLGEDQPLSILEDTDRREIMRACRRQNAELAAQFGHRYGQRTLQAVFEEDRRWSFSPHLPVFARAMLARLRLKRIRAKFSLSLEDTKQVFRALREEDRAMILQKGRYSPQYDAEARSVYCRLPSLPRTAIDYRLDVIARDQAVLQLELSTVAAEYRRYATPVLAEVFEGFNLVALRHHFHAIPDTLPVDWVAFASGRSYPEVRSALTLDELKSGILQGRRR